MFRRLFILLVTSFLIAGTALATDFEPYVAHSYPYFGEMTTFSLPEQFVEMEPAGGHKRTYLTEKYAGFSVGTLRRQDAPTEEELGIILKDMLKDTYSESHVEAQEPQKIGAATSIQYQLSGNHLISGEPFVETWWELVVADENRMLWFRLSIPEEENPEDYVEGVLMPLMESLQIRK